jgi:NitT/TauT family transport system substrate-binding protein
MSSAMVLPLRVIVCATLALLVASCGQKDAARPAGSGEPKAGAKPALRKVVLQSDWFPQAEHGGFYQALVRGFYREAGLDVEIRPGGPGAGIKLKVARGDADFGMNRSDDIIVAASRGLPLVMVAATLQHDPLALMLHESNPVRTFKDLNGRTVVGNVGLAYFGFLERKFGIQIDKRQNTYGLGEFLANPDLIQQCLVTNEPFFARQHGRQVRTLALAEAGYNSYHTIFCRRELIRDSPDVVRAFVWASVRGWQDYMQGDPKPANAEILKRNPQMSPELLEFSRSEMILRSLVHGHADRGEAVGQLSLARLSLEIDLLLQLKILEVPVAVAHVATKDFLPPSAQPK